MSKYTKNDWVRVTNPISKRYDMVGQIITEVSSSSWRAYVVKIGNDRYTIKEEFLTLADPDTHTVPGQMDAESAPKPNRRAQVLRTAESLVNGARADDYGPPQENFGRVAAMWSAQFAAKLKEPLTADEVAIGLVHLKLSRLANTPDHEDSWIDACGYLALGAEIAEGL